MSAKPDLGLLIERAACNAAQRLDIPTWILPRPRLIWAIRREVCAALRDAGIIAADFIVHADDSPESVLAALIDTCRIDEEATDTPLGTLHKRRLVISPESVEIDITAWRWAERTPLVVQRVPLVATPKIDESRPDGRVIATFVFDSNE